MDKIAVLVANFEFLTRAGLIYLILQDQRFSLVEASDEETENLAETVKKYNPDVLIMDYHGDNDQQLAQLEQIMALSGIHVLILSNDARKSSVQSLLDRNVKGIVTKNCSRQEIVNAIVAVSQDSRFYCNKILDTLVKPVEDKEPDCEPTNLSAREYEVLKLITKGQKTAEIADELSVSVHTINSHRKNILKKLGLKSPAELIVYAMETGLVKT